MEPICQRAEAQTNVLRLVRREKCFCGAAGDLEPQVALFRTHRRTFLSAIRLCGFPQPVPEFGNSTVLTFPNQQARFLPPKSTGRVPLPTR